MKHSFLCPDRVRKISVASYMWFLVRILRRYALKSTSASVFALGGKEDTKGREDVLVDVVTDERGVDQERYPLSGQQEAQGEEGVGEHLGEDELSVGTTSRVNFKVRGIRISEPVQATRALKGLRTVLSLLHRSIGLM